METQARYDPGVSAELSGTLLDFDQAAIVGGLTSLALTITDAHTGGVVNGRSSQNVLNSNNVTYNSSTAALVWAVQPGDLTPLAASAGRSWVEHVAKFRFVYGSGRVGEWAHRLRIVNYLTLCTVEDVRMLLENIPDEHRPLIEWMIESFSTRAEAETGRRFRKSVVESPSEEIVSILGDKWHIRMLRYPIDQVTEVREASGGDFSDADSAVVPPADYAVDSDKGIIKLRYRSFVNGEKTVRVRYAGGLARDVGAVPSDLRFAAARQVAWWYQRRTQMGVSEISVGRFGREQLLSPLDLLPDVCEVLDYYRPVWL